MQPITGAAQHFVVCIKCTQSTNQTKKTKNKTNYSQNDSRANNNFRKTTQSPCFLVLLSYRQTIDDWAVSDRTLKTHSRIDFELVFGFCERFLCFDFDLILTLMCVWIDVWTCVLVRFCCGRWEGKEAQLLC